MAEQRQATVRLVSESGGEFAGIEGGGQGLEQRGVALVGLEVQCLGVKAALLQVLHDQRKQVDVRDPQARSPLGKLLQQKGDVLAHPRLELRRVVEGVKGDFVAEATTAEGRGTYAERPAPRRPP